MLLKEISSISSGQGAPQSKEDYCESGITFIKASDLDAIIEDQNEDRASKITDEAFKKNKLSLFPKDTILFAKSGMSCLKNRVYVLKEASCVVNHLCCVSNVDEKYDVNWIALFLKHYNVTRFIKDNAYPSISLKDVGSIVLPTIDKSLQNQIVESISIIQKAIDLKRKQLEDLDELVKSKFQEMFGDPVENDKRWEMRVWKELFDTILGKMLDVKKQNSDDEIRLYLGNTNVQWRSFDLNGLKTMTFSNKEIDKLSLKKGDILICEGGESGRCAVWEEENSNILFQKAIHRARIKDPNVIEPHFIPFLMEFLRENNGLKNYVTQATIEHLTGEKLNKLSIIVPPIEQQKVFAEFARKADAANAIIKQEISDLEELMDSKMDEYFG